MNIIVLASGSGGNATFIEHGEFKYLIDCGITYRQIVKRLSDNKLNLDGLAAILITHEHHDHIKGLDVLLKRHQNATVYMTKNTYESIPTKIKNNLNFAQIAFLTPYTWYQVSSLQIHPFSVSHDASDAVGFILQSETSKLVYATDIGYLPKRDHDLLVGADMYIFESNYDVTLLYTSRRPYYLKRRIDSVKGHLSNVDSAYNMSQLVRPNTKYVVLAHRSIECNTDEAILQTYEEVFADQGLNVTDYEMHVASQDIPTKLFILEEKAMTNEQIITEAVSQILEVDKKKVQVLHRLMGGMSNYTYVVDVDGKKYTYRIPGKKAEKFVDRQIEKENIEIVSELGLNNETLYLDLENGHKLAEFIAGNPLSEQDPMQYLKQVADVLKSIHNSGLKAVNDYDPLSRLSLYESYLQEFSHDHGMRYKKLKDQWLQLVPKYMDSSRLVLCHGDSQISNFVVSGEKLYLMDWEFTGNNDPFYDIACFGNNDFNHALALLPVYLGHEPSLEEYNRLYFFRAYQALQWHNVALYKEYIGLSVDLGVDFKFVANLYLDKAERFLNEIE
jgi:phosphoribosyl 1,2-cyclic phosphodiesterase/thiamine kinase-like enzyme